MSRVLNARFHIFKTRLVPSGAGLANSSDKISSRRSGTNQAILSSHCFENIKPRWGNKDMNGRKPSYLVLPLLKKHEGSLRK